MTTPLEDIIKKKIRAQGPMNLADYMALCLGHPDHGYYMTRDPFGAKGDFTTAPEISQMFGEMIGAWIVDTWDRMGSPEKFILLECGPGRGTLMVDILRATKNVELFHNAMQLHLLESSSILKKLQAENLAQFDANWHDDLSTLPQGLPMIVIANEFLDALPVRQMILRDTGWKENVVNLDINDTLCLHEIEADDEMKSALAPYLIPPKVGERVEVPVGPKSFLNDLINIIDKQSFTGLFIDYGFIHNVAGDTVQAMKKHAYCGILTTPGEADITAHVNFSEISQIGLSHNMTVHGPVPQGDFLTRLGISIRALHLMENADVLQRREIEASLKRLTGKNTEANEMGALFKVIAFSSNPDINLAGFS